MKTREEIETKLAELRAELEADDFPDEEERSWGDVSARITALEWVLGIGDFQDEM